jgi:hypothetical protein
MGGKRIERPEDWKRPLLVLVGPDEPSRFRLATHLIDRENAVVLCEGPPGCPLVRGEDCAVVGAADAVVILPTDAEGREIAISLSKCARRAAHALVVDPTSVHPDIEVVHVPSTEAVAIAVPALLQQPAPDGAAGERRDVDESE